MGQIQKLVAQAPTWYCEFGPMLFSMCGVPPLPLVLAVCHAWKFLQPPPSPWMNQRPLGVDVNVGTSSVHMQIMLLV